METPNIDYSAMLQKSEEWIQERCGRFTASNFSRLIADATRPMTPSEFEEYKKANPKGQKKTIADPELLSEGAMSYILEVSGEILTGMSSESDFSNKSMEWGIMQEPSARKLYGLVKRVVVSEVGIVHLKNNEYVSGSPDGLVGIDGRVEIKCPEKNAKHLENLMLQNVWQLKEAHPDYYWQCIGGILLAERQWWDFVSYSPNFPGTLKLKIIRLNIQEVRSDVRTLAIKLKSATKKLKEILEKLKQD